ncbi:hypothetical protein [Parerythrobacter jejuensis]|uniref:Uncharacterized protein n=1 Tax=Parerythrobacter jejuensis TaxID=795812 RepID=A0A845AKI5_9SPHN|nr:hypothetical protein [Parerythrobacter jejuensis]MXP30780.1 hypothetical protein [Parerythrobacter jejuensis]MXP33540.1 hypothetical protein [Parerythrobacter jejuensis]
MDPVQLGGSLIAILLLAGLTAWLKLGASPRLHDESDARRAADQVVSGFEAEEFAIDRDGEGAILRGPNGQIMVLRPHGSHFAGRVLTPEARAQLSGGQLHIHTGERRFGDVFLTLEDGPYWVAAINGLETPRDA